MGKVKSAITGLFSRDAEEGYVPNREGLNFAAGLCGQNITYGLVSGWFFYFCTDVLKISPFHVGILTSVTRLWDGINDPIVGALVDHRKTKPGQKLHPYLGKLPIFIGLFTLLLFTDFGVSEKWAITIVFCVYLIWDMLYSFQDVALWGTLALISPHSAERSRIAQMINIGISVSGAFTGLIPLLLGIGRDNGISERWMFLGFGLVLGFGGELLSCSAARTKERVIQAETEEKVPFSENFKILLHNRNLLLLGTAQILESLKITVPAIYFFKYCAELQVGGLTLNGENVQFLFGLISCIPGVFSMFFAVRLAKLCGGMKRLLIANQSVAVIIRIIVYFIGFKTPATFVISALIYSVTTILGAAQNIALRSLITDSVDRMEWETGRRTEGLASSFQNFIAKISGALQLLINGAVLDYLHYDNQLTGITGQPAAFYKWQWPLYILGPAMGAILYIIPALFIKDNKEEKEMIEKELVERRAAANAAAE